MEDIAELVKYGPTGVAIVAVVALVTIVGKFLQQSERSERRHEASYKALAIAIDKSTAAADRSIRASNENLEFMRRLNGKLPKLVASKIAGKDCE